MMSLAGGSLRLPRVVWHIASTVSASADFAGAYLPIQMLGFVFAIVYLLLTWLLFWWESSRELRAAAIGLLFLAAGLFHVNGPVESVLGSRGSCRRSRRLFGDDRSGAAGSGILAPVHLLPGQRAPCAVGNQLVGRSGSTGRAGGDIDCAA